MTTGQLQTQIATDITNKTAAESITAADVGGNMADIVTHIDDQIAGNVQNNLMPSATKSPSVDAVLSGLDSVGLPYKSYVALISQSGTDTPTAIVINNELTGTPTFSRLGSGQYYINLTGAFSSNKTVSFPSKVCISSGSNYDISANPFTVNSFSLETLANGVNADDILQDYPIEIRVYN